GTVATSMGARVKHDKCSICGNKARSRSRYCHHLKNQKLQILDDGRQVYAINPRPRFVDLSFVVVRAAPESVVLEKVASLQEAPSNEDDLQKRRSARARAYGTLRPDEYQAVLQKDASLLRPDCIPYVARQRVEDDQYIDGEPHMKLASLIEDIDGPSVDPETMRADFLSPHEKIAYLRYRRNHTRDDRFLR
ncbi:MAG: hypothetical protein ABEN55_10905, partial [Bradymonadaceae bacterium]